MLLLTFIFYIPSDYVLAYDKLLGSYQLNIMDAVTPENALNAILAINNLDNMQLQSGQVFSFNRTIGPRSPSKGFIMGQLSSRSPNPTYGWGGGVCMSASLLHQAVKASNLPVLERHDHVSDTGYLPIGEDAAISWGVEDYRFYNHLAHPIVIKSYVDKEIMKISIYKQLPTPTICLADTQLYFANVPFIDQGITYVEMGETIALLKASPEDIITLFDEITNHIMPTYTIGNMTYLPLRELANLLKLEIFWDGEKNRINLEATNQINL